MNGDVQMKNEVEEYVMGTDPKTDAVFEEMWENIIAYENFHKKIYESGSRAAIEAFETLTEERSFTGLTHEEYKKKEARLDAGPSSPERFKQLLEENFKKYGKGGNEHVMVGEIKVYQSDIDKFKQYHNIDLVEEIKSMTALDSIIKKLYNSENKILIEAYETISKERDLAGLTCDEMLKKQALINSGPSYGDRFYQLIMEILKNKM